VQGGPYDITQILRQEPGALTNAASRLWGPLHAPHHWGQSIFGYYLTDDAVVLRKHAQMLADAGVDAICFDVSNQVTYHPYYLALLRVFDEARAQGGHPPRVAFLCPFGEPGKVVEELYRELYQPGLFPDLWFRWDGKPLILADARKLGRGDRNLQVTLLEPRFEALRSFFTFRRPQPDYFQGQTGPDEWSWLEVYPQHVFTNAAGQREQMSVGVAQNAVSNRLGSMSEPGARGRSFHQLPTFTPPGAEAYGLNVAEQWARARREDPRLIFITGWNEWIAGRFDAFGGIRRPVLFVDQFDQEHSRDIEPMRGGHGDSYYYQMAANIRRYKGVRPTPSARAQPISIDGRFDDWRGVEPEFRDDIGDPVRRDHPGWGRSERYTNHTGRNDLIAAKVSWDATNVYFYARTRDPLTAHTDPGWMLLFVDTDHNPTNGWMGYDVLVGRDGQDARSTSVERHDQAGYHWRLAAGVPRGVGTNEVELAIPRSVLGLSTAPATLAFKWADHPGQTGDWSDFTLDGDAAPNDRWNYQIRLGSLTAP
jgi:hypothetical protein